MYLSRVLFDSLRLKGDSLMKKHLCLFLCMVMTIIATMIGCTKPTTKIVTSGEEATGTFVAGITEASGNFNPLYYSSAYDGHVVDLVFEKLVARNLEGKFEGIVAESWKFSKDGKSITFKLKKDIVFSDGTPLTAHDIVFTYQVLADPSYTGCYGSAVKNMLGYADYFAQKTKKFKGVEALNDYTVKFNFAEALRVNLDNCAYPILPKNYYGKDFAYNNTAAVEAITSQAVGSGPYIIKEFKARERISLERNMKYHGEGFLIKKVIMKFVDPAADIVELTNGNVDFLPRVIEPKKIAEARNHGFLLNTCQDSGYGYLKFNCGTGVVFYPTVRQALYHAFNYKEFVNNYFKDAATDEILASTQYHPFSQASWAIDGKLLSEMNDYDFDLVKANKMLDDAGWARSSWGIRVKDGRELELKIAALQDNDIFEALIPMLERDWEKGIGVKLNITYLDSNALLDKVMYNSDANYKKWNLYFLTTSISTPDPHALYSSFHSGHIGDGMDNTSRLSNSEVDELFDKAKAIMNEDEAKPIYQEIAKILNEKAVMIPVYSNIYFDIYSPKLVNLKTNSLYNWTQALKDAKITK
jgi:peptide/nickel transport system substrate-binding protein